LQLTTISYNIIIAKYIKAATSYCLYAFLWSYKFQTKNVLDYAQNWLGKGGQNHKILFI
jgi:hypothetical protein